MPLSLKSNCFRVFLPRSPPLSQHTPSPSHHSSRSFANRLLLLASSPLALLSLFAPLIANAITASDDETSVSNVDSIMLRIVCPNTSPAREQFSADVHALLLVDNSQPPEWAPSSIVYVVEGQHVVFRSPADRSTGRLSQYHLVISKL